MGLNQAFLSQYMAGRPRALDETKRRKIAGILGVQEDLLRSEALPIEAEEALARPVRGRVGLRDLPLWLAGTHGVIDDGTGDLPEAFVPRIDPLLGNSAAWAAKVVDAGMAPCLSVGDTAYFDPLDPPTVGDIVCLVQELPDKQGRQRRIGLVMSYEDRRLTLAPCVVPADEQQPQNTPTSRILEDSQRRMAGERRRLVPASSSPGPGSSQAVGPKPYEIEIQPHMQIGRLVGMLRR